MYIAASPEGVPKMIPTKLRVVEGSDCEGRPIALCGDRPVKIRTIDPDPRITKSFQGFGMGKAEIIIVTCGDNGHLRSDRTE